MRGLPDFNSIVAVEKETAAGGTLKFGVGALTFPDGGREQAVAIEIRHPDAPGGLVTQFAMLMPTFEVLLESMMDVFAHASDLERLSGGERL